MRAIDSLKYALASKVEKEKPHITFTFGEVTAAATDGCQVLIDGETMAGAKYYKWVGTQPAEGDRVMLAWVSKTYVILGTLEGI